jgi:thiol-disulfide isomerase/thioredoxin
VVCGTIESDEKFHAIYIKDAIVHDTIAVIPVVNNEFHYQFKNKVITDYYEINIDGKYGDKLYFGSNDSIYVASKIYNNKTEFDIKGTRLAENQMNANTEESWSMVNYYLEDNQNLDKPKVIINALYKEWKEAIATPNKFRTIDNYISQNDFKERAEKLTTTKYLNLWNEFVKKRKALYPAEKTTETSAIKEIKNKLPLDDESLLSSEDYFNYVRSQLILKNSEEIDTNLKALKEISKLKKGSFKDKMLFWQLNKSLEDASNSEERNELVSLYNPNFGNSNYQSKINTINKVLESLGKGKEAPAFEASTLDGKTVALADLKGKFVMIDVWATWCGPCKQQAPYFEKMALKYKNAKIQFVSLSVDEDIKKWFIDAKSKSKSTLQLHINDRIAFGKNYSMESIPRFILIDPNGKFINAKMPRPEEAAFEIILRKELRLRDEKQ